MWLFYVLSILPLCVGAFFWYRNDEVVWWEWILSFIAAFLVSVLFHVMAFKGMTNDYETWSGQIDKVVHYPRWVEEVEHTETTTDKDGKTTTRTYYTYTTHPEYWAAYSNIDTNRRISEQTYRDLTFKFGNKTIQKWAMKTGFYSGDHNIYTCNNETGYCCPINDWVTFENRIKAAPTLFSFPPVPSSAPVFEYPKNDNWFSSDRLIGLANNHIDLLEFDRMNARLGPIKRVNVIVIGFAKGTPEITAEHQRAKFVGGRKNDLVICYAGGDMGTKPEWVSVFGWTESEICKENLKSLLLDRPINNDVLPIIEKEIVATYKIKDWEKFDYINIEPPMWSYFVFFIVMIGTQIGYWIWACGNKEGKGSPLFSAFSRYG